MNTILLATDGSESSRGALTFALDLALSTGASLELVSVGAVIPHGAPDAGDDPERVAEAAASRARAAGVIATTHAPRGNVVDCIVDAATSLRADLLVIGPRGTGPSSGALLGSVAQALLRRSPIPVTVVRHLASAERSSGARSITIRPDPDDRRGQPRAA